MARFFAISFVLLLGVALVAAPASGRAPQADPPGSSESAAAQAEASRWLARSRDHLAAGESEAALASAQRAVALAPRRPETHLMLANAYRARIAGSGAYRQLVLARQIREALQAAVALESAGAEAHLALVRFHLRAPALVGGSRREAGKLADIIVQRDPVRGALALGLLAQSEGDAELALTQFERADLLAPAAGPLRRLVVDLLGQSLEQLARWRAAGVLYAQSVDADPNSPKAGSALAGLPPRPATTCRRASPLSNVTSPCRTRPGSRLPRRRTTCSAAFTFSSPMPIRRAPRSAWRWRSTPSMRKPIGPSRRSDRSASGALSAARPLIHPPAARI
jgi:tetratricopeptide (TPR) repeat protein